MITIEDHGELKRVAGRLHAEAARMPKDIVNANAETAKMVKADIIRVAASILPKRGGLARHIAGMEIRIERKVTSVLIEGVSDYNVVGIDGGTVHHLVYGRRPTQAQDVTPGFFTKTVQGHARDFEEGVTKELEKINGRLEKG